MNGIHDMGGMHGFGPVPVNEDETFHADWERVVFAMNIILRVQGVYTLDEKRAEGERIPPAEYLRSSYFEHWLEAMEGLLVREGILTVDEIEYRYDQVLSDGLAVPEREDPALAAKGRAQFESDRFSEREPVEPRFAVDDAVVVENRHPEGHTRAPRYARRARGIVDRVHDTFPVPDEAAGGTDVAEPLYSVRCTARDLWGAPHEAADLIYLDLWERYLSPLEDR